MPDNQNTPEQIDEFVAAAHGDVARVKAMLNEHPALLDANASWNERAIQAAAQTANYAIAEFLLEAGAPLEIPTAAVFGQREVVESLLRSDPELAHARGAHDLPLMYFPAVGGQLEIAEILLAAGSDVNARAPGGTTALHAAVLFGQQTMAKWLLEHGAEPNVRDGNEKTPLEIAEENGEQGIAVLLQEYSTFEDQQQ
jgi:uncharacterized protein